MNLKSNSGSGVAEITFGYSTSRYYPKAVELCTKLGGTKTGEGTEEEWTVRLPLEALDEIRELYTLTGNWKGTRMSIDGKPATLKDLSFGPLGCYTHRCQAEDPVKYCYGLDSEFEINPWGCRRLKMPLLGWNVDWLGYGHIEKGVWVFDKDAIARQLEERLYDNRLCPALNVSAARRAMELLPDRIDPRKDPSWDYVTHTERNRRGKLVETVYGVRPSTEGLGKILKAFGSPKAAHSRFRRTRSSDLEREPSPPVKEKKRSLLSRLIIGILKVVGILFGLGLLASLMTKS